MRIAFWFKEPNLRAHDMVSAGVCCNGKG